MIVDWIEESKKFDQVADIYDDYRPGYPVEIINRIKEYSGLDDSSKIIEVGSGTGKATDLFIDSGCEITCVEQGENLVRVAKEKYESRLLSDGSDQVSFEVIPFQDYEGQDLSYDLGIAAQAFHWIPKPMGYKKMAKLLKEDGTMHLFWNKYICDEDDEISMELKEILKEVGALNLLSGEELETFKNRTVDGIEVSGVFKDTQVFEVPWVKEYTFNDLINFLKTGNGYIGLESNERHTLDVKLMDLFSRNHYKIEIRFSCVLFSAVKA